MDPKLTGSEYVQETKASDADAQPSKRNSITGDVFVQDHGADSDLRRILSTRHLTMIALGSSIGMGLWLGSGSSLINGGPAGIFLGYCLSGAMIWSVAHSIGEMAVMYPLPSAFVQWTGKFVDPSAAFALGWAYYFSFAITIANELAAANTIISFWTDKVPIAGWIVIWWVILVAVNVGAVTIFGEVEVVCSTIKFSWIFVVIISMIVLSAGGGPNHETVGFRYWNETPFTHGFKGFLRVMPTCIFAMSGSENAGLVAAETANPRKSVPRAVGSIWLRLSLFYLLGSLMVTINVSPFDPDLFGAEGTNASPFVVAYRNAGIPALAHIMNAIILLSVISCGSISIYAGARTVMGLAYLGMAPKQFKRADKMGRPWWGLMPMIVVGLGLAFLNVNNSGSEVFNWFSNLTSLFTLFGWGMICLSHIRFRKAWALQGREVSELPWKSWTYPYAAWFGLATCIVLIVVQFYLAVWPLGEASSAEAFFANYVSVLLILVLYLGAKVYYRGRRWVDISTVDLDFGRRFYGDEAEKTTGHKGGFMGGAQKAISAIFS